MIVIFESILPIFFLVLLGVVLRRCRVIDSGLWPGLEQLGYYVLFPSLLFDTLYRADFGGLQVGGVGGAALVAVVVVSLLLLTLWPFLKAAGVPGAAFTTVFQTGSRWNAFVALAMAQRLAGSDGLALVALVMAVIIVPINFINVAMLVWFSEGGRNWGALSRRIVTNPLILGCVAGLAMRLVPIPLYPPVVQAVGLVGRAALPLGLLRVGAGLKIDDALRPSPIAIVPLVFKLLVFPVIMIAACDLFGVGRESLYLMTLCAAVPTAMNGYLLARQMGGDAPLYAAVATLQTAASFLTMPLVLWIAKWISL
ncbi:MAG: AEC family transporter [Pararhizobium sp.]